MNNRQKAKHFKKLYEEALKRPYPVVFKTLPLNHCRIQKRMPVKEVVYMQDAPMLLRNHVENIMLRELRPYIWDNLITEKDTYTDSYTYTLDIWLSSIGRNDSD
jgi:hypothetical protein